MPGAGVETAARELAAADVQEVVTIDDPALDPYTPDGYTAALQAAIAGLAPSLVLLPHTYQTRDFAPKLAARMERAIITDVTAFRREGAGDHVRAADVPGQAHGGCGAAGRAPSFRDDCRSDRGGPTRRRGARHRRRCARCRSPSIASAIRQKPEAPFQEARQAVDLSQAERIVSVGRGIKEQANIALAQKLAEALHAELAASRPICDAGWLPMERQVGSSGQTVAPKLYLALGISGAIQHLVGMKGSSTIVAINKDPDAPIFEVADYGIVGDLFEIVPALIDALEVSSKNSTTKVTGSVLGGADARLPGRSVRWRVRGAGCHARPPDCRRSQHVLDRSVLGARAGLSSTSSDSGRSSPSGRSPAWRMRSCSGASWRSAATRSSSFSAAWASPITPPAHGLQPVPASP